jgi:hypothetical protein
MKTTTTTLTLNVTYEGDDATAEVCRGQLEELVRFAAARGLLTGDFDMTVEDFDYTTTVKTDPEGPRILATFRPQDENCHYIHGAERTFDVTEQILAMGKEEALAIEDHTESADMLYHGQDEFEWDNPFEVEVEEAIRAYYGEK